MVELSYSYINIVITHMVKNNPRFSIIHKPIHEIVFFFETLFARLVHAWIQTYPSDFFGFNESIHINHLREIVHEVEREYNTPSLNFRFILDFFKDALHQCKIQLSSPLYEHVLMMSLQNKKKKVKYYPHSNKIAVIVDPRYDPFMEAVIHNFMHYMNPHGWNLMIFSHESHRNKIVADFPTALFAPIAEHWMISGQASMTTDSYNKMFIMKSFWESIPATHIAVFQKDCIMYKMFDESLFLQYDFAGASFHNPNAEAFFYGGINGGFSLRNKQAMIECCEKITWEHIIQYNKVMRNNHYAFLYSAGLSSSSSGLPDYNLKTFHEDVFFINACEILKKRVPDSVMRDRLAIEASPNTQNTCIYHGWNKNYHTLSTAKELLEKSDFFFPYLHDVSD